MRAAELVRSPSVSRLALCAAFALATAGCSSDTNRFETPFSNPFSSSSPDTTGSVPAQPQAPNHVESRPLPQPGYQQAAPQYQQPLPPPPRTSQAPATVRPQGVSGGGRGVSPYQPQQDVTGSVNAPRPAPAGNRWDWNGGTPVTVGQGETIETLSHRYGVPALAIAEANGMTTGTPIYPGQRLVIPKYAGGAPRQAAGPQLASAPLTTGSVRAPAPSRQATVHTVAPGETMFSIARRYKVSPLAIANANKLPPHHMVRMGERLTIPGTGTAVAQAPQAPRNPPAITAPEQRFTTPAQPRMAEVQPQQPTARVITPAKDNPAEDTKPETTETTESTSPAGGAGFRWPARGRVITGFGPKPTGQQNDGINLALPEGTPIKASDDGVVAYAGNELKGYGNLVLVRHSNGFVTAYAHASELLVKRGDQVKRGQTIAKSGQTGNVASPQLHFEIRKGATPVDPMQHLTGAS